MKNLFIILFMSLLLSACTKESQNKFSRSIQNWTGTNGVLDIYMGEKLVKRFIKIDKLSTAESTSGNSSRDYRYGYGVLDSNLNFKADPGEKKLYFEISGYATPYIFYDNPNWKYEYQMQERLIKFHTKSLGLASLRSVTPGILGIKKLK